MLPATDCFLAAMADRGQPAASFRALEMIARETVGAKLFTVMAYDAETTLAHRLHTSDPVSYPTSGSKPLSVGLWSSTVIERKEPFVANTIEAISEVFPDHELIDALGCQSVVNVPVVFDGEVIGTVNLLHVAGFYTPDKVNAAMTLRPYAAIALIAARAAASDSIPTGRTKR